ncbi:MAG: hypothetical protein AAB035_04380 [Nitrospirota bacterium]
MRNYWLICFAFILALVGCATTSQVAEKIDLGMSKQDVLKNIGKPLKKEAFVDSIGANIEIWQYQETTWDDGGWSWNRTIVRSLLTFKNGFVIAMGNLPDRYRNQNPFDPTVNINVDDNK